MIVEREKNREVKLCRWMYHIIGGIYESREFSSRYKYWWLFSNFLILLLFTCGALGYFWTVKSFDLMDSISILWMLSNATFVIIVIPWVTLRNRPNFEKLFDYIQRNPISVQIQVFDEESKFQSLEKKKSLKEAAVWLKVMISLTGIFYLMPVANVLVFSPVEEKGIRSVQNHMIGIPHIERIPSVGAYLVLFVLESLLVSPLVIALLEPALITTITGELNNIAIDFCCRVQVLTNSIVNQIEQDSNGWDPKSAEATKLFDCFENRLKTFIRQYHQWRRAINSIRPYIRIFSGATLSATFTAICCNTLVLLSGNFEIFLKLRMLATCAVTLLYLYPHCLFGTTVNNLNEAIFQQVYNLPWYYLPARRRVTFQIFLNQIQQPVSFKAFGTLSMNISIVPKLLRFVYSFVSVLSMSLRQKFSEK